MTPEPPHAAQQHSRGDLAQVPPFLASVRRVAIGSRNPVKIAATEAVIARFAPNATFTGIATASGVSDQPFGDDETIRGAMQRARAALVEGDAALGVGIEGGVVSLPDGGLRTCAWAVIVDATGRSGTGGSLSMPLPARVSALVQGEGLELGVAMDRLTGERGIKHGRGAVGVLTAGLVDRQQAYEILVSYALAPWLNDY